MYMGRRPRPPSTQMTTRTSVRIPCCGSEATFRLYLSTRRRRYDARSCALGADMKRREFLGLLGGGVAWSLAARAQQPMPVIGFLRSTSLADATHLVTAFRQGLREANFVEGQNVGIEFRSAEGRVDRLPALVADLVGRKVAVMVGNHNAALAAKNATITISVVFVTGADPVRDGLVASLNRPGGNVTGVSFLAIELGAKRLDLLRQLVPNVATIAMLVYPDTPDTEAERRQVQAAAQTIGQQLINLDIKSDHDIETAFTTFVQRGAGALFVRVPARSRTPTGNGLSSWRPGMQFRRRPQRASGTMSRYPSSEPTGRDNGYFRAKVAQEKLIETSGIPYTIIRSTQFLEFLGGIAASSADGNIVRLSPGLFQPIAADDVAAIVADVALAAPREMASSRSPARNERRSTKLSPAI